MGKGFAKYENSIESAKKDTKESKEAIEISNQKIAELEQKLAPVNSQLNSLKREKAVADKSFHTAIQQRQAAKSEQDKFLKQLVTKQKLAEEKSVELATLKKHIEQLDALNFNLNLFKLKAYEALAEEDGSTSGISAGGEVGLGEMCETTFS